MAAANHIGGRFLGRDGLLPSFFGARLAGSFWHSMSTATGLTRSVLVLAALAAGCGDSLAPVVCDGRGCATQVSTRKRFQAAYNRKLDILFVVDDTPAIAPQLDTVATGIAAMAPSLTDTRQPYSLHVGFVRAGRCDASTRGAACGVAAPTQFLTSEWCNTISNQTRAFADTFACLGDFGAASCGPAQPLSAAAQALAGSPRPGWEGFLRPDAYLMIVVISGSDDASDESGSPTDVITTAALIKSLKQDPSQVLVSIIGPGDCGAVTAPRLTQFGQQFGANGLIIGLCAGAFPAALERVTSYTSSSLLPPCIRNVRDTDPATPGLQADCTFEDSARAPDGSYATSRLPSCDQSAPPCWRLSPGGQGCSDGWAIEIERAPDWCYEAGTSITLECLVCASPNDPACAQTR